MMEYPYMTKTRGGEILHINPHEKVPLKRLKKGTFSTVYQNNSDPTNKKAEIYTVTMNDGRISDHSKEIIAIARERGTDNPYLPAIDRIGMLPDNNHVFRMPFYVTPLRKDHGAKAWRYATALQRCLVHAQETERGNDSFSRGYSINTALIDCMDRAPDIDPMLLDAVKLLVDNAMDYGSSYTFEFPIRNLVS